MNALKTYRKTKEQAAKLAADSTHVFNAEAQAKINYSVELRTQQRRAMRLTSLLDTAAVMVGQGVTRTDYETPDDAITRFCEPTLNYYGFALVGHPTKRGYLTVEFKEQA